MWNEALSLFFPRSCTGCERPLLRYETFLCTHCLRELPHRKDPEIRDPTMELEFAGIPHVTNCFSLMPFIKQSSVQRILHALKYSGKPELGIRMGRMLGLAILPGLLSEIILPVPLHPRKLKERGYNQSEMIALGVREVTGQELINNALVRTRYTLTQTTMHRLQRQDNMRDLFDLKSAEEIRGRSVLLIDDVFTTGATACSIARLLADCNPSAIQVAVLARAE